ncbi:MAG: H-NS family nucleoid-associated regulatory protein [Undibacterium sp.]|uniref:H-NS family nucleoid-associated regulatory protein n=1 Tax=Undibacterium sp. TaxID=1914977 RepID=UPI00271CB2E8|nr:H-NS family nucleoid-associated regulatory protein [Undibacterium sp.]MDO8652070.1 H-NS family nucleoid-associated regulatory protein [Undibacterium sp.]
MIAKNYIKHPDALRFQCEMFGRGHTGHYPRIMRLMEVIFDWTPTVPQWVKDAKARAAQIVKAWKSRQVELFEMIKTKAKKATWHQLNLVLFPAPEPKEFWNDMQAQKPVQKMINGFYYSPTGQTWSGRGQLPRWLRQLVDQGHTRQQFQFNQEQP